MWNDSHTGAIRDGGPGERGITLVEVMAAMIVLALGLLAILPMAVTSMTSNNVARDTRGAMEQIQNHIERLRTADSVVAGTETDTLTGMRTDWRAEDEGEAGLKKLIVEVSWVSNEGVLRRQRGTAYVYRKH